ncbi:hypothetical protein PPBDW_p0096 (plasmid) [Photobacterium kishitanii]|nr:hypothetical protein PPBDW_p0096 [Photobacterium kishitanii]
MHLIKKVYLRKGIKQRQVKHFNKGMNLLFAHQNLITTINFKI